MDPIISSFINALDYTSLKTSIEVALSIFFFFFFFEYEDA